jgi:YD repeat-containing protein
MTCDARTSCVLALFLEELTMRHERVYLAFLMLISILAAQAVAGSPFNPAKNDPSTPQYDTASAFIPALGSGSTSGGTGGGAGRVLTLPISGLNVAPMDVGPLPGGRVADVAAVSPVNIDLYSKQFGTPQQKFQTPALEKDKGVSIAGVNTMTGRFSQSISLGSVSISGGTTYPLLLSYLSPPPDGMNEDSRMTIPSDAGYGWNLDFPFIVVDHKGTTALQDDDYFAYLGPWGSGKMVPVTKSNGDDVFQLDNNPNIEIHYTNSSTELGVAGWVACMPDGTTIVLGGRSDAIRKTLRKGGHVGLEYEMTESDGKVTPVLAAPDFNYQWDVTEIRSPGNRGIIRFDWQQTNGQAGWLASNAVCANQPNCASFVRESWPSAIWSAYPNFSVDPTSELAVFPTNDLQPHVIDKVTLGWGVKTAAEVLPYNVLQGNIQPGTEIQTKYLSSLVFTSEGTETKEFGFQYNMVSPNVDGVAFPKRFLKEVTEANGPSVPAVDINHWYMEYDGASGWLSNLTDPNRVATNYSFKTLSSPAFENGGPDSSEQIMNVPFGYGTAVAPGYNDEHDNSTCIGQFCYAIISDIYSGTSQEYPGFTEGTSMQVFMKSNGDMRKIFEGSFAKASVIPQDGYFIVTDTGEDPQTPIAGNTVNHVYVYQWDGTKFVESDPFLGDRLYSTGWPMLYGKPLKITQVVPSQGDYFLVKFHIDSYIPPVYDLSGRLSDPNLGDHLPDGWDIIPVVRDSSGSWKAVNPTKDACLFSNYSSLGVDLTLSDVTPQNGECMEYLADGTFFANGFGFTNIQIAAMPDFFVLAHGQAGVIEVFRRNYGGNYFVNETARMRIGSSLPSTLFQSGRSWQFSPPTQYPNPGMPIGSANAGPNYFSVQTKDDGDEGGNGFGTVYVWRWDGVYWTPTKLDKPGWVSPQYGQFSGTVFTPNGYSGVYTDAQSPYEIFRHNGVGLPSDDPDVQIEDWDGISFLDGTYPRVTGSNNFTAFEQDLVEGDGVIFQDYYPNQSSYLYYGTNDISKEIQIPGGDFSLSDLRVSRYEDWIVGKVQNGNEYDFYYTPLARNPKSPQAGIIPSFANWIKFASAPFQALPYSDAAWPSSDGLNQLSLNIAPKVSIGPGVWMKNYGYLNSLHTSFSPLYSSGPVARDSALEFQVVSSVTTQSLYKTRTGNVTQTIKFDYGTRRDLDYDGLRLQPESRVTTATWLGQDLTSVLKTQTISYLSERLSSPLDGTAPVANPNSVETATSVGLPSNSWLYAGNVSKVVSTALDGITTTTKPIYQLRMNGLSSETAGWAKGASQIAHVGDTIVVSDRGSTMTKISMLGNFDAASGQPQVSLSLIGNTKGDGALYRHEASVATYNPAGKPTATWTALYETPGDALALLASPAPVTRAIVDGTTQDDYGKSINIPTSGTSVTYGTNNIDPQTESLLAPWTRGADSTKLTTPGEFLLPQSSIPDLVSTTSLLRSPTGGPQYTLDYRTKIWTSYVYEGMRGLPSAVAWNANPNNFAVLTGEDGGLSINGTYDGLWNGMDLGVGQWEAGNAVPDNSIAHTGRYSMHLSGIGNSYCSSVDANGVSYCWLFGPTRNVYLKNVANLTNGMTVSAWIYSSGIQPVLAIEQRTADHTPVGELRASPVGGTFIPNSWQQWKVVIPETSVSHANFGTGQPLFSNDVTGANGDYLRVWVGFQSPVVNSVPSAGNLWVDDFVISPTDAKVTLQSYDYAGRVIGAIDPDGHTTTTEFGPKGEVQAVRDERGRTFGQSTVLQPAEN